MEVQNRIMVIDDDEITRKSLKNILEEEGYEIETAKTGREGVEKIHNKFFNITLLDIKLPDVEGTELLIPLKKMHPDMNIIMITGASEIDSAIKALNRGAAAYILKPLDIDSLLGRIRGFIEKQRLIAEKRKLERELKKSFRNREKLENIINRSPLVVVLWECEEGWPVKYVSENIEQFGYSPEEFYTGGISYSSIIHPDDLERVATEVTRYSTEGISEFKQEYRIITKNKDICWIEDRTWIRRDQNGEITHYEGLILDITERKVISEKLRQSEERMRLLSSSIEQSTDGIAVADLKGNLLYANNAFSDMHGYTSNELIGNHLSILHTPDQMPSVEAANQQILERGEFTGEIWHTRRDGSVFPSLMHNSLFRDEMDNPVGIIGTLLDITEKKEAEEKLRQSEERYRQLLENLDVGFYQTSLDGQVLNHNRAHNIILGYDLTESLKNKDVREFWQYPEQREEYVKLLLEKGIVKNYTCHVQTKDGRKKVVELNSYLIRDENEKPIRIDGTFNDITEKYNLEKRLKESEERYRNLYEEAPNAYFSISPNQIITRCNKAAVKLLGYSKEDFMKMNVFDLYYQTENGLGKAKTIFQRFLSGKEIKDEELQMRHKNGNPIWVSLTVKASKNQEGQIIESRSMVIDITARKKAEEKLRQSEEKYRFITESANDLIFVVSKNVKTEYINEEVFKKLLGYSNDDVIGKSALKFIHPEDLEKTKTLIMDGLKFGEGMAELRCIDKNGHYLWLEIKGKTFVNRTGNTKGIFIARDITERKKREAELEKTSSKLKQIFNITIPLCVIDKEFNIIRINNTFSSMFNVKREEIIGRKCYDTISGRLCNTPECTMRQIQGGKDHWDYEKDLKLVDGTKITCKMRAVPFQGCEGEIIGIIQNYTNITERKRIEDMLKLSDERYSLATNAAKVGVWDWNFENGEFYLDPNIKIVLGYRDEEIPNDIDLWKKIIHPDDSKGVMEAARAHLEGKTTEYTYEHRMLHKDGSILWVHVHGRAIRDTQGKAIRMIGVVSDITELKRFEKALQNRNRDFSALLEASRAVLEHKEFKSSSRAIFDSCAKLVGTTDGFISLLTPDKKTLQILSLNIQGSTREANPDLAMPIHGLIADVASSKKVTYYNTFSPSNLQLPVGHIKLKNFMLAPLIFNNEIEGLVGLANKPGGFNEDDAKLTTAFAELASIALMNSLVLTSLEESEQRYRKLSNILEQKVEERTYELKNSEEKILNMVNNISDVLMEGDIDDTITFVSPQIYDITGYRPKELIGIKFLELIHPEEKLSYKKLINTTPRAENTFSVESRIMHKKGYYVPISAKGSVVAVNNRLKIFVVVSDITEKRKIDEMMKSEIKKLQDLDQIRSDLIRRISHELKTPLISIFSGSQYLLDHSNDKVKGQTQSIIRLIHMGGYRLKSLVDNLILTYSIELKDLHLDLNQNNIIQIIKNCIEGILFHAKKRKIFINIELLSELYVEVDKSMIKRAISNILSNAVKNTPANGNIFVRTFEHPNYLDIIVKDDGVGLTKKELPLLFKRFGKIERHGKGMDVDIEGAGLGLYIANEIVKLHNGEIIINSKGRNKGSTFTIRLYLN